MKKNDWKERLNIVYSTNPDFSYESDEREEAETLPPSQLVLRIQIEKKGRGGKTATLVRGFVGSDSDLNDLARMLKMRCGVGGSAKDGLIVIQGELKEKIIAILKNAGYTQTK